MTASIAFFVLFLFSAAPTFAATTYHVKVGGVVSGVAFTKGEVWFNGFDPATIVIHPGDTVTWDLVGGVHTVTSEALAANGSFLFDSSPLFTPQGALADMGPGLLLPPGSVYLLDTSTLALGTYTYLCKIHAGMRGNLTITSGVVTEPVVTVIAGFGDAVLAHQAFAPAALTVPRGTVVKWTLLNPTEPHTITGFDSTGAVAWDSSPLFNPPGPPPVMLPGDHFSYTFNTPGTFVVFCKVHAYKVGDSWVGMVGTVNVVPYGPEDVVNNLTTVSYIALGLAVGALVVAIAAIVRKRPTPKP